MLIKYLTCCAGYGFVHNPGDVVDVREAEGGRLIAAGLAERATPPAKPVKHKRKAKPAAVADDPAAADAETADAPLLAGE